MLRISILILVYLFPFSLKLMASETRKLVYFNVSDTIQPVQVSTQASADTSVLIYMDQKYIGTLKDIKKIEALIPPENIESINVLKGKAAVDKYGEKGMNGVIEFVIKKIKAKKNTLPEEKQKD